MSTELTLLRDEATQVNAISTALISGDLSKLSEQEKASYYVHVCKSVGLNYLTKPLQYLELSDDRGGVKVILYATKGATDQLRGIHGVDVTKVEKEIDTEAKLITVTVYGKNRHGRTDCEMGVVSTIGYSKSKGEYPLSSNALANAYMKALTKAKRRLTLSLCGLGYLDESEVETIPNTRPIDVELQPQQDDVELLPNPPLTVDSTDFLAISNAHLERLGLDPSGGKAILKERYNKTSRAKLTDEEYRDFIEYLAALETSQLGEWTDE